MSEVKSDKLSPVTATTTTFGDSGDKLLFTTGTNLDMNGVELILDADADTSITADTDDQIDIRIAGADDFQFTANTFTALSGSTVAIASGATIANSGTATGFGFASGDVILADDGAVGAPGLSFADDTNNGIYRSTTDTIGVVTAGRAAIVIDSIGRMGFGSGITGAIDTDTKGLWANTDDAGGSAYKFQSNANGAHNFTGEVTHGTGAGGSCVRGHSTAGDSFSNFEARQSGTNTNAYTAQYYAVMTAAGTSSNNLMLMYTNTTAGSDKEYVLRGDGNGYCDGSWSGGGADYAEMFEWTDGNSAKEDRVGISVVLTDGNKIRPATGDDDSTKIIGVMSGNPVVVGDHGWNKWHAKHVRDEYNRVIWEDVESFSWVEEREGTSPKYHNYQFDHVPEGVVVPADKKVIVSPRRKINPDWIDTKVLDENGEILTNADGDMTYSDYTPREDRPEWDAIGLVGKLRMKKGQPTGDRWIKMRDVSADVEEWLVR